MKRRRRVAVIYAPRTPPDVGHDLVVTRRSAQAVESHLAVLGVELQPTLRIKIWRRRQRRLYRKGAQS